MPSPGLPKRSDPRRGPATLAESRQAPPPFLPSTLLRPLHATRLLESVSQNLVLSRVDVVEASGHCVPNIPQGTHHFY